MKNLFTYLLLFLVADLFGYGALTGHIYHTDTEEPIILGTVGLYQNGVLVAGTETDFEGNYTFNNVAVDEYKVEASYIGFHMSSVDCVTIQDGQTTQLNISLELGVACHLICGSIPQRPSLRKEPGGTIFLNNWTYKVGAKDKISCEHLSSIYGFVYLWYPEIEGNSTPAIFATVALYKGVTLVAIEETGLDGKYNFKKLEKGDYTIKVNYLGYQQGTIEDINLISSEYKVSLDLEPEVNSFPEVVIVEYKFPLISGCGSTCVGTTFCGTESVETYPTIKEVESDIKVDEAKIKIFPNLSNHR